MPTAKSYQGLPVVSEVYTVSGRKYVDVKTDKGETKRVRWYTDYEYAKMYPETQALKTIKPLKEVLGFAATGYITVFYGETYENKDWFVEHSARYNNHFGWYLMNGATVNTDELPIGVETAIVNWEDVAISDNDLKPTSVIKAHMDKIIYPPNDSKFVGEVGERITVEVTIEKNIVLDGYYGINHLHIMKDAAGNVYTWSTASKDWQPGETKKIKGSVKEHKIFHNQKQTVLLRCVQVK